MTTYSLDLRSNVQDALIKHQGDERLSSLLEATTDAASVTGKCKLDDVFAAQRLMELAKDDPVISRVKLVAVMQAMNVVLTYHGLARHQRRTAVRGTAGAVAAAAA